MAKIFDTESPFAHVEFSYGASTASALGRTCKLVLTKKFYGQTR